MDELYSQSGLVGPFTTIDEMKAFTQKIMEIKKLGWARVISSEDYNSYLLSQNKIENFKEEIGDIGYLIQSSDINTRKKGIFSIFG